MMPYLFNLFISSSQLSLRSYQFHVKKCVQNVFSSQKYGNGKLEFWISKKKNVNFSLYKTYQQLTRI